MQMVTLATALSVDLSPFVVIHDTFEPEEHLALAVAAHVADSRGLLFPTGRFAGTGRVHVTGSSPTGTVETDVRVQHLSRYTTSQACPRCEEPRSWVAAINDVVDPTAFGCFSCGWVDAGNLMVLRPEAVRP